MSAIWYALHSKPRKEAALERQARAEGFEVYLPLLRVKPVNPRSRKSTVPHTEKRRYPVGVDPRRQRRQERAAERLAAAALTAVIESGD